MSEGAAKPVGVSRLVIGSLLGLTDAVAAVFLAADLVVVILSVLLRSIFNAPVEWSDDIARGLMVASSFFGAAGAVARGEECRRRLLRGADSARSAAADLRPWARC